MNYLPSEEKHQLTESPTEGRPMSVKDVLVSSSDKLKMRDRPNLESISEGDVLEQKPLASNSRIIDTSYQIPTASPKQAQKVSREKAPKRITRTRLFDQSRSASGDLGEGAEMTEPSMSSSAHDGSLKILSKCLDPLLKFK